jgi:hypothetical protein
MPGKDPRQSGERPTTNIENLGAAAVGPAPRCLWVRAGPLCWDGGQAVRRSGALCWMRGEGLAGGADSGEPGTVKGETRTLGAAGQTPEMWVAGVRSRLCTQARGGQVTHRGVGCRMR